MASSLSDKQKAYMLGHEDDSLVINIIVCCSICSVASTVFLLLRLYSQYLVSGKLRLAQSEYLLIIAWASFVVCFASSTKYGGGRHIVFVENPRMVQILNIADENTYAYAMAFVKLSILRLYGSIFSSRQFHYFLWAIATVMIAWAISCGFAAIFQCRPIAHTWDPLVEKQFCINYGISLLVSGVINIATDFTILALPIPMVLSLHMSKQKKRLLIFTFAMGGSACIISIIRLAFTIKVGSTADGSWDDIPAGLLSVVELMFGILAASIPTYRPLYRRIIGGSATLAPISNTPLLRLDYGSKKTKANSCGSDSQLTEGFFAGHFQGGDLAGTSVTNQIELGKHTNGGNWQQISDNPGL
ncbi:hypothetical protein F5Y06DRAFT_287197 [Hypoxylon sp. FL0890]|nr:hypothetical protein F5Y06DRAFT_287197 [Hypoxylon sp. FL0890]